MKIVRPSVKLVHSTPFPETIVEEMGRVCYQSEGKKGGEFTSMLIKRGHESVLEHVSAGFRIVTDRGVTHELVRHRIASFSQESTRYCDYTGERFGGDLSFIEPPGLEGGESSRRGWSSAVSYAEEVYRALRTSGVSPQIARAVLPNSLKAEIGMTANAREWRHFLKLRLSASAHPQMREVAEMIRANLYIWYPAAFDEFRL
jgi:thymidylate synthase (FAD)